MKYYRWHIAKLCTWFSYTKICLTFQHKYFGDSIICMNCKSSMTCANCMTLMTCNTYFLNLQNMQDLYDLHNLNYLYNLAEFPDKYWLPPIKCTCMLYMSCITYITCMNWPTCLTYILYFFYMYCETFTWSALLPYFEWPATTLHCMQDL